MTIKELNDYQMICSKGSLSKAAKALFITPQGLGRMLKNLEAELECTLIHRGASGMELTESGMCLLEYARQVTAAYDKMKEKIDELQGCVQGSVELLLANDLIRLMDLDCFGEFRRLHPKITCSCREYPDRMVEQYLAEGLGSAALSIGPFSADLFHIQPLMQCRLCLIAYEGHPLWEKAAVTVEDLMDVPLCLENSSFKINEFVQRKCWLQGFEPNIVQETSTYDLCYRLCRMKRAVSVVPDFIHEDMKTEGLRQIPFEDPEMALEIAFLTPKSRTTEQAVDTFCGFLKNRLGQTTGS